MKKRKTYEISVIDKTYSKTISDETKFYTSDTALELGFKLKETDYTFESAEIVLLNIDDRSLVTRPVSKVLDSLMINLFAMQVTLGWLKVEDIPEKYRSQVEKLLALADGGVK